MPCLPSLPRRILRAATLVLAALAVLPLPAQQAGAPTRAASAPPAATAPTPARPQQPLSVWTRLEQDGLIVRETDPADRRNLVMRLTGAGRALYRRIEPVVLERERDLLAALAPAERAAFENALARIEAAAGALQQQA